MKEKLRELLKNSYSPYSNFKVSSICVMKDGTEFGGVNVENATYGATVCAERVAILSAIAAGYKKGDFKELYVMCEDKVSMPCFSCRSVIVEFFEPNDLIVCMNYNGGAAIHRVSELCPYPFTSEDLK